MTIEIQSVLKAVRTSKAHQGIYSGINGSTYMASKGYIVIMLVQFERSSVMPTAGQGTTLHLHYI